MAELAALQQLLGIQFKEPPLLEQALTHSSFVNENPGVAPASNERLEFLGDAILGMMFAQKLYQDLPNSPEGELTKLRSDLVRRGTLFSLAKTIGLGDYLYLGKGEEASGGRDKPANLARAMEAMIAAVFLDQGWDTTRDLILRLFDTELKRLERQGAGVDYKSQLQHFVQSRQQETPSYRITETTGPDHQPRFTAEVMAGNTILATGHGRSKKLAETEAAYQALEKLKSNFTQ